VPSSVVAFIYRTRVLYFYLPLLISIAMKHSLGQTTPLPLVIAGSTVAIGALAFRMFAASFLHGRHVVASPGAEYLCTSGPYAYVRNPLYLANFIIGLAMCLTIDEWYAYAIFLPSFAALHSIVIPHEEVFLRAKFRNLYEAYSSETPRFFPRPKRPHPSTNLRPDYRAGVLRDLHVSALIILLEAIVYLLFVA
jgi:protein-S-isoprenylcysteine O-methyltransferase Ste14